MTDLLSLYKDQNEKPEKMAEEKKDLESDKLKIEESFQMEESKVIKIEEKQENPAFT